MRYCLLLFIADLLLAQSQLQVEGIVKARNGEALVGVNVFVKGTIDGAVTNENGAFSFSTDQAESLVIKCSMMGYRPYEKLFSLSEVRNKKLSIVLISEASAEEIVVVASAYATGDNKSATLKYLDVVTTPGAAADIFRAIQVLPGVQQVTEGAGLYVRGGDVSETVVILDGAYVKRPYRFETLTGGFFGTIPSYLAPSTSFYAGGYSAQYGNALSAALILNSMNVASTFNVQAGASLAAISAGVNIPIIKDKLGVNISGNYVHTFLLYKLNALLFEMPYKVSNYPQSYDLNANVTYQYSETGRLKLFLFRQNDQVGVQAVDPNEEVFYTGGGTNNLVNLSWQDAIGSKWIFSGNLAYSSYESERQIQVLNFKETNHYAQARFTGTYSLMTELKFNGGVELIGDFESFVGTFPQSTTELDSFVNVNAFYPLAPETFWLELEGTLFEKLGYRLGGRLTYDFIYGKGYFDPRLSITWKFIDDFSLSASGGKYSQYQNPNLYDANIGNNQLLPSEAWHAILGIMYKTQKMIARLEGYYKSYQQLVLNDRERNYTNNGYGTSWGLDAFFKYEWRWISGWVSYSFVNAQRLWQDAPKISPTTFDIRHTLSLVLKFDFNSFGFGATYRLASGRPYTSSQNTYNDKRTPLYHKLDIQFQYLYTLFNNLPSVFFIAISNATLQDNIFGYVYSSDFSSRSPIRSSLIGSIYFGVQISI